MRFVLVLLLATALAGCGALQKKFEAGREFAKEMRPDHNYRSYTAQSESMAPTIRANKDMLLVDLSAYDSAQPQRGDIIVFMPPLESKNPFIKRILAVPGDTLAIHKGAVRVNGRPPPHSFPPLRPNYDVAIAGYRLLVDGVALDSGFADIPPRSRWTAPNRLPAGCYFTIGDYAENSEDSHVWGCTELRGTFSSGTRKGQPTELVGKVVKIVRLSD
jgi:signal peptidase I